MLESLVLSSDAKLSTAIQQMCVNVGIRPEVCTGPEQAVRLMAKGKFYGIIVDSADPDVATELIKAVRKSPSSRRAVSIAVLSGSTGGLGAMFELRTPLTAELALRTFRAARAAMLSEFRRYCRRPLETPAMVTTPSGQELHARIINLSQGGLGVQFPPSRPIATRAAVRCRFALPPAGTLIEVKGEVVWSNSEGRAGLQCQGVSPRDRQNLEEWLANCG